MKDSGRNAGALFYGHGKLRGPVWATKAAFLKHGASFGQKAADYPPEWHYEYERQAVALAGVPMDLRQLAAGIGGPSLAGK